MAGLPKVSPGFWVVRIFCFIEDLSLIKSEKMVKLSEEKKHGAIQKSQVMLELVVGFVIICIFLIGIINLWVWADLQMVGRQIEYDRTRKSSATLRPDTYGNKVYPVYDVKELNETWVVGEDMFGE